MSLHQFLLPAAATGGAVFTEEAAAGLLGQPTRFCGAPATVVAAILTDDRRAMHVTVEVAAADPGGAYPLAPVVPLPRQ